MWAGLDILEKEVARESVERQGPLERMDPRAALALREQMGPGDPRVSQECLGILALSDLMETVERGALLELQGRRGQ